MTTNNTKKPNKKRGGTLFTTKELVVVSALIAVAMVLSRLEALVPIFEGILPGYKIGLANVATVFALYALGWPYAILISVLRVFLTLLMFPKFDAFMLSLAGAILALVAMILLKQIGKFSPVMVSVAGGLAHNVGQVIAACFLVKNTVIIGTLIPLFLIGTVTGILIGVISGILIKRLKKYL